MSIKGWFKKLVSVPVTDPGKAAVTSPVVPTVGTTVPSTPKPKKKKDVQAKTLPTVESTLPEITIYPPMPKEKKARKPRKAKVEKPVEPVNPANLEKAAATAAGEPWVAVTSIDLDLDNLSSGSFSLDWNEIFVAKLIRAGYKGKSDIDLVDQWFSDICRNVLAENYEQAMSDPTNRTSS